MCKYVIAISKPQSLAPLFTEAMMFILKQLTWLPQTAIDIFMVK